MSVFPTFPIFSLSSKINGGDLREKLACYIRDNKELYQKVLQFQVKHRFSDLTFC